MQLIRSIGAVPQYNKDKFGCAGICSLIIDVSMSFVPTLPRWELAAENIAVKIRWIGVLVGYLFVNLGPSDASRPVLNSILALGTVFTIADTAFSLKGGGWYKDLYSSGSKSEGGGSSKPASDAPAAATPSPSTGGTAPSHATNKKPDSKT